MLVCGQVLINRFGNCKPKIGKNFLLLGIQLTILGNVDRRFTIVQATFDLCFPDQGKTAKYN
jgi:hypothetical protein